MNKLIALAVGALGALGSIHPATAAPAWCAGAHFDNHLDLKMLGDKDPVKVITTFAQAACTSEPEVDSRRADIEKNRAAWGARLGMVESDWADVIAFIAENRGSAHSDTTYSTKELAQFTPVDQYKAIDEGFQISGGGGTMIYTDARYLADVFEPHLSQVGRYAYISGCMVKPGGTNQPPGPAWAVCQGDIEKFELATFNSELHADTTHGGGFKQALRFDAFDIKARIAAHAADVQAAWKQDPAYKKMFEVTAKARAEWASGLGTNPKLLELAQQLDSARLSESRKQFEGCEARTEEALKAEVAKVSATQFKGMHDIRKDPADGFANHAGPYLLNEPGVSLAAMPYILCHKKDDATAKFLAVYLAQTIGYRGPRSMALSRLFGENFVLDDLNEKVDWPKTTATPLWVRGGGPFLSAGGVVKSMKTVGEHVVVELTPLMVKHDQCTKSHKTGRISQVLINGDVVYETICDASKTFTENEQYDDFEVDKKFATLLKPGIKFSAIEDTVLAIWPNKTSETPTWLLGAVVK